MQYAQYFIRYLQSSPLLRIYGQRDYARRGSVHTNQEKVGYNKKLFVRAFATKATAVLSKIRSASPYLQESATGGSIEAVQVSSL